MFPHDQSSARQGAQSSHRTQGNWFAGLLIMVGFLTLISALPAAVTLFVMSVKKGVMELPWAALLGLTVTTASAAVGALTFWIGACLANRQWQAQETAAQTTSSNTPAT